ncbi:MAG TPA: M15 family metallopeptidase [Euzebyales bacterium]|nr:M15 family metallopeptidase [Euzebyales bacterium]
MCVILIVALLAMAPAPAQAAPSACPSPDRLPPTPFVDLVSATHRDAIACASWYDLSHGITPTTFGPLGAVRRDQMAAFLARTVVAANVPLPSEPPQPFTDVAASAHRDAIAQMAELDLVRGTHDTLFEPAAPVRRGQMAAFLVRLVQHLGIEAPAGEDAFADDDGTAHEHDINAAAALGLAEGVDATSFAPGRRVRREQMASFLARLVEVLVERGVLKRRPIPAYSSAVTAVPQAMRAAMTGISWHRGCPVPIDKLALLTVTHWDFNAEPRRGHLIVARSAAADLAGVFRRIYTARFQIEHIRPLHTYGGRELASLNGNNTSAFDCRPVTGGSSWSEHSYGTAVDINPRQNPYIKGALLLPADSRPWVARTPVRRGMISPTGPVTRAFKAIGWGWGGDYRSLKDYQHFSASGR